MPHGPASKYILAWDRSAAKWAANVTEFGDRNKEVLITPLVMNWLGEINGLEILDAGCGEGFLCRLMAEKGAQVTGTDYSQKMLDIAHERTPSEYKIFYRHLNLEKMDPIEEDCFDLIVSILTLQDIPDHLAALEELHRVLQPGGRCFLAFTHPCFTSDGGWILDEAGNKLYWKTDRYFQEREVEMCLDPESDDNPLGFHRTLTSYYRAIRNAGFTIKDLIEPYPSPDDITKHPGFQDDLRMCHFIVFDLEK